MMKLYQNKEWLYNKYWGKMLSPYKIFKLYEVSQRTLIRWLKKFNISCRSRSEANHLSQANHCNLSQKAIEWINGELLGDGNLYLSSKYSAGFAYGSKHKKYAEYVSNTLDSFEIKQVGRIRQRYYKNLNYHSYHYTSRSYIELLPIRKKWYPKGKKIIPKDLKLTPLTCRQWYIGDGYLDKYNKSPYIELCTCGFDISDVEFLVQKLNKLGFKTTRQSAHNIIHISSYSTKDFLNYIGKCPVKCYEYKWDY